MGDYYRPVILIAEHTATVFWLIINAQTSMYPYVI